MCWWLFSISAVINRVLLMRTESGSSRTIVLWPSKPAHQPFLKRTPSSKSQWVEIDFDPPEKLVYIIHLVFGKLQREADMKFERHQRSRVGYCHAPVLLLLSTASLFSLALLCYDKYYHLWFVRECVRACSAEVSCICCTVYSQTVWFF